MVCLSLSLQLLLLLLLVVVVVAVPIVASSHPVVPRDEQFSPFPCAPVSSRKLYVRLHRLRHPFFVNVPSALSLSSPRVRPLAVDLILAVAV
jgi:hypothetical protein